jgi:adenylosuccinate lyase
LALVGELVPERIEAIEATTKHDVLAFVQHVSESVPEAKEIFHFGLTSSDVVDTALSMAVVRSGAQLRGRLEGLREVFKRRALETKDLKTIGRTHGMYAEPTSFGLKFASFYTEAGRNLDRLNRAIEEMRFGKLSGAVGNNAHLKVAEEEKILGKLGLKREKISTQVLPRDRHAEFASCLAIIGGMIERVATEVRNLQRSEVGEVYESFSKGQKGSSAMPHKRNPIASENLVGVSRMLRGYALAAFENIALWHERDISHSGVERVALVDSLLVTDYALDRLTRVVDGLEILREPIQARYEEARQMALSGHLLLAMTAKGWSREQAYQKAQALAFAAKAGRGTLIDLALKDAETLSLLGEADIKSILMNDRNFQEIDAIFSRCFDR